MSSILRIASYARGLGAHRARMLATVVALIGTVQLAGPLCGQAASWIYATNGTNITSSPTSANVGIGTQTPGARLEVNGGGTSTGMLLYSGGSANYTFLALGRTAPEAYIAIPGGAAQFSPASVAGDLVIRSEGKNILFTTDAGSTTQMYLKNGGNVGISTTSPASWAALDINTTGTKALHVLDTNSGGVLMGFGGASIQGRTSGDANGNLYLNNFGGNVGIGTSNPQSKLAVNGTITTREVIVTNTGWSDYVFRPDYRLLPLNEVAAYVKEHHHLPEIPSESEVQEKGVSVGEMQSKLLAKIEELTLHMIRADERNRELQERISRLENPTK